MRYDCHLVIYDPRSDRIFLDGEHDGSVLPSVQVLLPWPWTGDVKCINQAAAEKLGQDVITLRCVPLGATRDDAIEVIVFMETRASAAPLSPGRWVDRHAAAALEPQPASAGSALAAFLHEIDGDVPARRVPWARPGWFAEANAWAETELRRIGRSPVGAAEQVRQWSISSVMRIPTYKGDAWFKAMPSFFRHEGELTRRLGETSPAIPTVLALDGRRGWMLMDAVSEVPVAPIENIGEALRSLATIQTAWVGRTDELLALGCPDRRIKTLPADVQSLPELGALRADLSSASRARLDLAVAELPGRCAELARCGVPETLMHGDFHPGNVIASAAGPALIDWTDGCLSHPFFDLATMLPDDTTTRAAWLPPYLACWRAAYPSADIDGAYALSESLACLHHAVSYQRILDAIEPGPRLGTRRRRRSMVRAVPCEAGRAGGIGLPASSFDFQPPASRACIITPVTIAQPQAEVYQLNLPLFEGPLDLLLHLIEREELDITGIALVAVTDQYMAYLHESDQLNLGALADFIAIGARLLLLKSRALLPRPLPDDPPSEPDDDDSEDLARQLIEYKLFKTAAGRLRDIETAGLHSYPRIAPPPELPAPTGLDGITLDLLQQLVVEALTREPPDEPVAVIRPHKFTVREKVELLRELLASEGSVSFRSVVEACSTRMEIIISFMAVLELIKSRVLDAVQDAVFEDIVLVPSTEAALDVPLSPEFAE